MVFEVSENFGIILLMEKLLFRKLKLIALFFLLMIISFSVYSKDISEDEEEKIGKKAAKSIEKRIGVLNKEDKLKELKEIADEIKKSTERPEIDYKIKILNSTDVNAFALPGGYIFITNGLLNFAQSEHELAGIIAHEMAHIVKRHALKINKKAEKLTFLGTISAIVALILADKSGVKGDVEGIFLTTAAVVENALSGYGRKAEREADNSAILYLKNTKYSPVGLLTFIERLLREKRRRPWLPDPGIFQTHPEPEERVEYIEDKLKSEGVKIDRRLTTKLTKAEVRTIVINNQELPEIFIRENVVFQPASSEEGLIPKQRAEKYAKCINQSLDEGAKIGDLTILENESSISIYAGTKKILTVYSSDAEFHKRNIKEIAEKVLDVIRTEMFKDFLESIY